MEQNLTEQEIVRREKMQELRNKGIDPFGSRYERTATSGMLRNLYGEKTKENWSYRRLIIVRKNFYNKLM